MRDTVLDALYNLQRPHDQPSRKGSMHSIKRTRKQRCRESHAQILKNQDSRVGD